MMDDFMDYVGYRNMVMEEKIDEGLKQARNGETEISIDRGDLTDSEMDYVQREVKRRRRRYYG